MRSKYLFGRLAIKKVIRQGIWHLNHMVQLQNNRADIDLIVKIVLNA